MTTPDTPLGRSTAFLVFWMVSHWYLLPKPNKYTWINMNHHEPVSKYMIFIQSVDFIHQMNDPAWEIICPIFSSPPTETVAMSRQEISKMDGIHRFKKRTINSDKVGKNWDIWSTRYYDSGLSKPDMYFIILVARDSHYRRKFRSETSDNMDSWKAEVRRVRREKIRRKKM